MRVDYFCFMNIGFDAKRAFHNGTGLGHYSRSLIHALSQYYPQHQYWLFNPRPSQSFSITGENIHEVLPSGLFNKTFSAYWRSSNVVKDLKRFDINLYHGLSHEIPVGINASGIKSVVTIHDLIHERYPEQYNPIDVRIYSKKFRYACNHADHIIAISRQTKKDIVDFYKIPEDKITVCYQSCNPIFVKTISEEAKQLVKKKYNLPDRFFLYVGSLIVRKNLLNICKSIKILKDELKVPLVVIGDGKKYKEEVKKYILKNDIQQQVIFLSDDPEIASLPSYRSAADFPAIYQSAIAMIYPSYFEGFGIPVLEALWSRLPVITSNVSCLPEAGGPAAYYVNPAIPEEIAAGMKKIFTERDFANELSEKGWQYAQNFTPQKHADSVIQVYDSVV